MAFLEDLWGLVKQVPITMRPHDPGGGTSTSLQQMWEAWPANQRKREDEVIDLAEETGAIGKDLAGKFRSRKYDPKLLGQLGTFYGLREKAPLSQTDPALLNDLYPETRYRLWEPPTTPGGTHAKTPAEVQAEYAGRASTRSAADLYQGAWPPPDEQATTAPRAPYDLGAEAPPVRPNASVDSSTLENRRASTPLVPFPRAGLAGPPPSRADMATLSLADRAMRNALGSMPTAEARGVALSLATQRAEEARAGGLTGRAGTPGTGSSPSPGVAALGADERAEYEALSGRIAGLEYDYRQAYARGNKDHAGRIWQDIRGLEKEQRDFLKDAREQQRTNQILQGLPSVPGTSRSPVTTPTQSVVSPSNAREGAPQATTREPSEGGGIPGAPDVHLAIIAGAQQRGLDPVVALSYIAQESNNYDVNAVGPGGEVGLGQFTRGTTQKRKLDPVRLKTDWRYNLNASLDYLAELTKAHGGNIQAGLRDYNGGSDPDYLRHVRERVPTSQAIVAQQSQAANAAPVAPALPATSPIGPPTAKTTPEQAAAWRATLPGAPARASVPPEVGQMAPEDQASYAARVSQIASLRADYAQAQEALQLLAEAQARNPKAKLAPSQQQWQHHAERLQHEITRLEGVQSTLETESRRTRREAEKEATKAAERPGLVGQEALAREGAVSTERGKWVQAAREAMAKGDTPGAEDAMMRSRVPRNEWPA